ncbi:hypothetical protein CH296_00530 [Rhodococcus sp. 14-2496-1d]|uniref:hypothetical protein n=1 Tax=Rhodococcus sp. 14-2496-1d TaxID=2023146 RepID=UPI000B9A8371|nr:hypothetical protein [Rhodococcus sp. 14-2496-1d]OZF40776.1 hypothetical protein CH296_00530 [Rhodococcus sp. 14-2496-1d]
MTAEIEHYQPAPVVTRQPNAIDISRQKTDDWFESFGNIVKLSEYIAETDFVPDAMRRKPAAVASAILTGREMGVPPMASLRHIHVVKGKPGQSAELMRAQAMNAGHEIRYVEMSDTRCVVEGRRRDESDWTRISFTVAQAQKAKIDLGGYPEDKLVARATSRLCRRKFPDAISGLPTVDELEDGVVELSAPTAATPAITSGGEESAPAFESAPVQRAQTNRKPRKAAAPKAKATPPSDDLLDDGNEQGVAASDQGAKQDTPQVKDESHELTYDSNGQEMSTQPQWTKLNILLEKEGLTERDKKLEYLAETFHRPFDSSKELTLKEASELIDFLEKAEAQS